MKKPRRPLIIAGVVILALALMALLAVLLLSPRDAGSALSSLPAASPAPTILQTTAAPSAEAMPTPTPSSSPSPAPSSSPSPSPGETLAAETPVPSETAGGKLAFFPVATPLPLSEEEKMALIDPGTRPVRFVFDDPVTLYAATTAGRPASKPSSDTAAVDYTRPVYSSGCRAAFIKAGGDMVRWFAYTLDDSRVKTLLWQVSRTPFAGGESHWQSPVGLLSSGKVSADAGEFSIDFRKALGKTPILQIRPDLLPGFTITGAKTAPNDPIAAPRQQVLYVRAVALDAAGQPVGEPGRGLEVLYGDPAAYRSVTTGIGVFSMPFQLLSCKRQGEPTSTGEFRNTLEWANERFYDSTQHSPWYFRPTGFPAAADTVLIQVSASSFTAGYDGWMNPPGLVYEQEIKKGTAAFDDLSDQYKGIPIDFSAFAAEGKAYNVRAVALQPGSEAGTVRASYSRVVKVNYGPPNSQFVYYPTVQIDAGLPRVELLGYQPIRWEYYDWMYWYEAVRQPTYGEYFALLPAGAVPNADELVPGIGPGTVIKFEPPQPEDKSWLEEAWDAVCDFFGSIVDFIADVVKWVSNAYAGLKSGLVAFVAANLPLIPDSFRDELEAALTAMVDYGLASIGIPPSLPNFDDLTDMGVDYLASVALEQAGIPATDLTVDTVRDLGRGIADGMNSAANSGSAPNPMNWNFVRQYPEALYRPAYILLRITNNTGKTTPAGVLGGRVYRQLTQQELYDGDIQTISATFGGSTYFELYRPVTGVAIPRLLPNQSVTVPVYLQEYTGACYSWSPVTVTQNHFIRMYNHFGKWNCDFTIHYDLPDPDDAARAQGLPAEAIYEYAAASSSISFVTEAGEAYVP